MATDNLKTFTVQDNVYKGKVSPYVSNYKSLAELIWIKMKKNGDKIAHLNARTEKVVTYTELQDKVVRCALWLQKQGIKPGDVVSVCTNNHLNSIVPCLAAIYVNAIFNPWNEDMDLKTALHVMQLTTPKVIFCSKKPINVILNAMKESNCNPIIVVFDDHPDTTLFSNILSMYTDKEVANFRFVQHNDIKQTACILYSSGTTGMPKGVEMSNYCLLFLSEDTKINLINAVSIWFSSLYWFSGVMMNLKSIVQGATVIIYPEFDEEMTCKLIEKYKVNVIFLSPSMINRFFKRDYARKYSLSSLETIIFGGATIKPKVQEEMRHTLPNILMLQGYGMTELGGPGTLQLPHHKAGSSGTVLDNVEIKIVDPENGKALGPNNLGELWIKTAIIMNGYYKNPEATKCIIDKEGWLHSGDVGYFDEDGELFIIDRIGEFIKYKEYQISPGEIEGILMRHPEVMEAAVVGVPHSIDGEHPVGYVTKIPGAKVTKQELIDLVANNLKDQYKLRAGVIFLDVFPYTGSVKIARNELKIRAKELVV